MFNPVSISYDYLLTGLLLFVNIVFLYFSV